MNEETLAVDLAKTYRMRPWPVRVFFGTPLIYLPILTTVPFVFVGVVIVRWHLKVLGARNLLRYRDFIPPWVSHRYTRENQITTTSHWWDIGRYKVFWLLNCKLYCPLSVALFRYAVYLIKIVENWWCPFAHQRKPDYSDATINGSWWHADARRLAKLHPDDANDPIWNEVPDKPAGEQKN